MISRILVPMDDSEMSQEALEYVLENHPDAEITVLHVVSGPARMGIETRVIALEDEFEQAVEERAEEVFDRARELAAGYDVEITTEAQLGHPTRTILNRANDFDVVVIGSHGGSLTDRLFVGNVAQKVFHQSPIPVIVVR